MGGKPIIRGMRFRVVDVLQYLAGGDSRESLLDAFDFLEDEAIIQALGYTAEAMLRPMPELEELRDKTADEDEKMNERLKANGVRVKRIEG
jgi:uncharacterized protein (DUF433 family)